jgi:16S rRNA (cytosine1402-N4)-methyltransferase
MVEYGVSPLPILSTESSDQLRSGTHLTRKHNSSTTPFSRDPKTALWTAKVGSAYQQGFEKNVNWARKLSSSPSLTGSKFGRQSVGRPDAAKHWHNVRRKPSQKIAAEAQAKSMGGGFSHRTVLLHEVVDSLNLAPDAVVVDCTLGGGGHSEAILEKLGPEGRLFGFDRDGEALAAAGERLERFGERFVPVRASFSSIREELNRLGIERIDGLVADLGVSSHQLDRDERGFSFRRSGPVDMRMNSSMGETAAEFLERMDLDSLATVLGKYGEVHRPYRVARAILAGRPYADTVALADVIAAAAPQKPGRTHPATRAFQAIRIAVNDELGELETLLGSFPSVLSSGGKAAIISFHSLEDRLVKRQFFSWAGVNGEKDAYGHLIEAPVAKLPRKKAIQSTDGNPRARSARLRILEWV